MTSNFKKFCRWVKRIKERISLYKIFYLVWVAFCLFMIGLLIWVIFDICTSGLKPKEVNTKKSTSQSSVSLTYQEPVVNITTEEPAESNTEDSSIKNNVKHSKNSDSNTNKFSTVSQTTLEGSYGFGNMIVYVIQDDDTGIEYILVRSNNSSITITPRLS